MVVRSDDKQKSSFCNALSTLCVVCSPLILFIHDFQLLAAGQEIDLLANPNCGATVLLEFIERKCELTEQKEGNGVSHLS